MSWGEFASVFLQFTLGLIAAALTAAMPYILPVIKARLEKATDKDTADKLMAAADAAAGAGYKYAATHKGGFRDPVVAETATQIGVDYLHQEMPGPLAYFGKGPASVRKMVEGRLGQLMAQDPTISAAVGSAVPQPSITPPPPGGLPPTPLPPR